MSGVFAYPPDRPLPPAPLDLSLVGLRTGVSYDTPDGSDYDYLADGLSMSHESGVAIGVWSEPKASTLITISDSVTLDCSIFKSTASQGKELEGTVRFVGKLRGKETVFYGVELKKRFAEAGDGTYKSIRYFKCAHSKGIFVKRSKIMRHCISNEKMPRLTHGDFVKVFVRTKYEKALIRYCGVPVSDSATMSRYTYYFGLELLDYKGDCDGSFHGQRFFKCEARKGLYVKASRSIQRAHPPSAEELRGLKKKRRTKHMSDSLATTSHSRTRSAGGSGSSSSITPIPKSAKDPVTLKRRDRRKRARTPPIGYGVPQRPSFPSEQHSWSRSTDPAASAAAAAAGASGSHGSSSSSGSIPLMSFKPAVDRTVHPKKQHRHHHHGHHHSSSSSSGSGTIIASVAGSGAGGSDSMVPSAMDMGALGLAPLTENNSVGSLKKSRRLTHSKDPTGSVDFATLEEFDDRKIYQQSPVLGPSTPVGIFEPKTKTFTSSSSHHDGGRVGGPGSSSISSDGTTFIHDQPMRSATVGSHGTSAASASASSLSSSSVAGMASSSHSGKRMKRSKGIGKSPEDILSPESGSSSAKGRSVSPPRHFRVGSPMPDAKQVILSVPPSAKEPSSIMPELRMDLRWAHGKVPVHVSADFCLSVSVPDVMHFTLEEIRQAVQKSLRGLCAAGVWKSRDGWQLCFGHSPDYLTKPAALRAKPRPIRDDHILNSLRKKDPYFFFNGCLFVEAVALFDQFTPSGSSLKSLKSVVKRIKAENIGSALEELSKIRQTSAVPLVSDFDDRFYQAFCHSLLVDPSDIVLEMKSGDEVFVGEGLEGGGGGSERPMVRREDSSGEVTELKRSIECWKSVVEVDPKNVQAWLNLAQCLECDQQFEEAVKMYAMAETVLETLVAKTESTETGSTRSRKSLSAGDLIENEQMKAVIKLRCLFCTVNKDVCDRYESQVMTLHKQLERNKQEFDRLMKQMREMEESYDRQQKMLAIAQPSVESPLTKPDQSVVAPDILRLHLDATDIGGDGTPDLELTLSHNRSLGDHTEEEDEEEVEEIDGDLEEEDDQVHGDVDDAEEDEDGAKGSIMYDNREDSNVIEVDDEDEDDDEDEEEIKGDIDEDEDSDAVALFVPKLFWDECETRYDKLLCAREMTMLNELELGSDERYNLMAEKLEICCEPCDFSRAKIRGSPEELLMMNKQDLLLECVDEWGNLEPKLIPEYLIAECFECIEANIFRSMSDDPYPNATEEDEDEWFEDPAWDHLHASYDLGLRMISTARKKFLQNYITDEFLRMMMSRFKSADRREHLCVQIVFRSIYKRITAKRPMIIRLMTEYLLEFMYLESYDLIHKGFVKYPGSISELVQIITKIFDGMKIDSGIKEELKLLWYRVILPLHKSIHYGQFHNALQECVHAWIKKVPNPYPSLISRSVRSTSAASRSRSARYSESDSMIRTEDEDGSAEITAIDEYCLTLLKYWPQTNHKKRLKYFECVCDLLKNEEIAEKYEYVLEESEIVKRIVTRIMSNVNDLNVQIAHSALSFFVEEPVIELIDSVREYYWPIMIEELTKPTPGFELNEKDEIVTEDELSFGEMMAARRRLHKRKSSLIRSGLVKLALNEDDDDEDETSTKKSDSSSSSTDLFNFHKESDSAAKRRRRMQDAWNGHIVESKENLLTCFKMRDDEYFTLVYTETLNRTLPDDS